MDANKVRKFMRIAAAVWMVLAALVVVAVFAGWITKDLFLILFPIGFVVFAVSMAFLTKAAQDMDR